MCYLDNMKNLRDTSPSLKKQNLSNDILPVEVIHKILWRYNEHIENKNSKDTPYKPKTIPRDLDRQILEAIDTIMSNNPEELEKIEWKLLRIREEDTKAIQLMNELQDQEAQRKKIIICYQQYTWYLQKQQFQTAIKYFKAHSKFIIEWYVLYLDDASLSEYISILSNTVNTKSIFRALPKFYTNHLFIDTLVLILQRRQDVVKISQDSIKKIAPFFPIWNQFILPE